MLEQFDANFQQFHFEIDGQYLAPSKTMEGPQQIA
jgi:hypothetical protein